MLDSERHFCTRASIRFVSEVTLISLFQIPASLTCSKLCGVQGGAGQDHLEGIRVISFLRGQGNTARYTLALAASTIIVDSTNRLQMEVTRGVEEIVQDGNRMVQDQDSMSVAGQEILEAGLVDRLGNCVDYLLNTVWVVLVPVQGFQGLDRGILVLVLD